MESNCSSVLANFKEMFPVHNEFNPKDSDDEKTNQDRRLLNEVIQKATYGFSSSEFKLNELTQGGKYNNVYQQSSSNFIYEAPIEVLNLDFIP